MFKETKTILPLSLCLSAIFALFEAGNYLISWLSATLIFFLGLSALYALWKWAGKPRPLLWILIFALFLRLISATALQVYLPINGYKNSEQQQAGYVFNDAYNRDTQAYELAQSDAPLTRAFTKKHRSDQYGGLLALSAGIYRYLSPDAHRPLLIILFAALFATLGIPFLWMASKEIGGTKLALPAAWIFALYPESILMGSSQMREPFLISLVAITLWAFLNWQKDKNNHENSRKTTFWGLGLGFGAMLLISPAIAIFQLIFLSVYKLILDERKKVTGKQLAFIAAFLLLSLFLLSSALSQSRIDASTPFGIILEWTQRAIKWDIYQLEDGSGWVQKLLAHMPSIFHIPFVTAYGLTQPVLPAAIIEPTTLIWKILGVMRALGWYLLAPFLLYGFFSIPKQDSEKARRLWTWFGLACWTWIIISSLRAGGDQWDNPRYRVIFLALEALFFAWAWLKFKEGTNSWLPRILTIEAIFLAFFTQWYASRYYVLFGTLSFGAMVTWILALSAIVVVWGILRDKKNQ